ncbi:hypothetical protein HCN44_006607 [Aphidius gifuensis]|uniref:Peptidase C1A papain C-terminal domain-containing protein n=1 Tax=Aphidius gifuensis TaxID=684658 RepID=A0A834Y0I6_APHGI|nr:hypothetical protein HCN44_006607 [Aphidius gifuensis]
METVAIENQWIEKFQAISKEENNSSTKITINDLHPRGASNDEFAICFFTGAFSKNRKIITQSGKECECRTVNDEPRIFCSKIKYLSYGEILKTKQSSWSPRLYSTFEDKKLNDVVKYLGTKNPKEWLSSVPRPRYIADYIDHPPKKFDPRSDKTRNVSPIKDQGACGTSWAVSVADVISDRLSLEIGDKKNVSAQQFIDCVDQEKQCAPGNPADAWNYSKENKLISEEFYPSTGIKGKCQKFDIKCEDEKCHLNKLYTVNAVVHFFNNYIDIMNEVYRMGPVQATMRVYEDFFFYGSGIYKCPEIKNKRQKPVGYHSVRIIGWSETDDKEQYWIAANSWGTSWGENGYFKIAKGINACAIEYYVVGVKV